MNDIIAEIEGQLGLLQRQARWRAGIGTTAGCERWSCPGHSATLRRLAMESDRLAGLIGDLNTERERLEQQLDGVPRKQTGERPSCPGRGAGAAASEETEQTSGDTGGVAGGACWASVRKGARRQAEALAAETAELPRAARS